MELKSHSTTKGSPFWGKLGCLWSVEIKVSLKVQRCLRDIFLNGQLLIISDKAERGKGKANTVMDNWESPTHWQTHTHTAVYIATHIGHVLNYMGLKQSRTNPRSVSIGNKCWYRRILKSRLWRPMTSSQNLTATRILSTQQVGSLLESYIQPRENSQFTQDGPARNFSDGTVYLFPAVSLWSLRLPHGAKRLAIRA